MSCVRCAYESDNKCYWFKDKRVIPDNIFKTGCNFFVNKLTHPLLNYAIVLFNGRII